MQSPLLTLRTLAGLLLILPGLTGCQSYRLEGVVVSGSPSGVAWVAADDPRLVGGGLASAKVTVHQDPDRFSPRLIAQGTTQGNGQFSLPLDATGSGLLLMDVEIAASRAPDHARATKRLELPQRNRRLLITLQPGDHPAQPERGNLIDQTLRDAEPFLRD